MQGCLHRFKPLKFASHDSTQWMDSAAHKIIKRQNRAQQAFPNLVSGCPKNTNNFSGIDLNNLPGKHIGHGHGYVIGIGNWSFIYIYIYILKTDRGYIFQILLKIFYIYIYLIIVIMDHDHTHEGKHQPSIVHHQEWPRVASGFRSWPKQILVSCTAGVGFV